MIGMGDKKVIDKSDGKIRRRRRRRWRRLFFCVSIRKGSGQETTTPYVTPHKLFWTHIHYFSTLQPLYTVSRGFNMQIIHSYLSALVMLIVFKAGLQILSAVYNFKKSIFLFL